MTSKGLHSTSSSSSSFKECLLIPLETYAKECRKLPVEKSNTYTTKEPSPPPLTSKDAELEYAPPNLKIKLLDQAVWAKKGQNRKELLQQNHPWQRSLERILETFNEAGLQHPFLETILSKYIQEFPEQVYWHPDTFEIKLEDKILPNTNILRSLHYLLAPEDLDYRPPRGALPLANKLVEIGVPRGWLHLPSTAATSSSGGNKKEKRRKEKGKPPQLATVEEQSEAEPSVDQPPPPPAPPPPPPSGGENLPMATPRRAEVFSTPFLTPPSLESARESSPSSSPSWKPSPPPHPWTKDIAWSESPSARARPSGKTKERREKREEAESEKKKCKADPGWLQPKTGRTAAAAAAEIWTTTPRPPKHSTSRRSQRLREKLNAQWKPFDAKEFQEH